LEIGKPVNSSLKFAQNQRFEIIGFLVFFGAILWFDPRREHSSVPTAQISQPPRGGPVKAGRVFRGHPKGSALIGPSTAASLIGSGLKALPHHREIQTGGFR
jgi:hypothetical protein